MTVLYPDLSIDTTEVPALPPDTGMTVHGHITTSHHQLCDRFGQPDRRFTPHRNAAEWILHTPAGRVDLRRGDEVSDSAGDRDVEGRWLILAASDDVLPWIYKAVHGTTAAFPAVALPHFSEATLHGFGHAYLAYLYLRMKAETERRDQLDRTAPGFHTDLHRPRQINRMLIKLADVLLHHEWAHATEAERIQWSGMQRPAPSEGLRYWKARNRWLYEPVKTGRYPHGGDPDLPGMLRALADTARAHRDRLLAKAPELDFALYDEHEQTLRALADTPIPGLDALLLPRS